LQVRDLLLNIPPHDIDLCTTATPEEMAGPDGLGGGFLHGADGISNVVPTGLQHGTITAVIDHEPCVPACICLLNSKRHGVLKPALASFDQRWLPFDLPWLA
jgi:hypothetical protein